MDYRAALGVVEPGQQPITLGGWLGLRRHLRLPALHLSPGLRPISQPALAGQVGTESAVGEIGEHLVRQEILVGLVTMRSRLGVMVRQRERRTHLDVSPYVLTPTRSRTG